VTLNLTHSLGRNVALLNIDKVGEYDYHCTLKDLGHAVAQFVEALCYKPEGRGLDSRWGYRDFH
jgi:hypothetical protein